METSGGRRSRTEEAGREVERLEMRERAGGKWVDPNPDPDLDSDLNLDLEGDGGGGRR